MKCTLPMQDDTNKENCMQWQERVYLLCNIYVNLKCFTSQAYKENHRPSKTLTQTDHYW